MVSGKVHPAALHKQVYLKPTSQSVFKLGFHKLLPGLFTYDAQHRPVLQVLPKERSGE